MEISNNIVIEGDQGDHSVFSDTPRVDSIVKLGLGNMRYKIYGDKDLPKLVICIHGIGSFSYCWNFLCKELEHNFRVISVDLLGRGKSTPTNQLTPQNKDYFDTVISQNC